MNKHKRVFITCLYLVSMASIVCHAQDKDIASLIQQLEHTDTDVRSSARKALIEIGEAAVPALFMELDLKLGTARRRRDVVGILHKIRRHAPHNKAIVRALVKALKDDNPSVRNWVRDGFMLDSELPPEVISGFVQLLDYGSPRYSGFVASDLLLVDRGGKGNSQGKAALIEALHSSQWSLRFGAAIAYGYTLRLAPTPMMSHAHLLPAYKQKVRISTLEKLPPETIKAAISTLAEGLTQLDWRTQEHAMLILRCLRYVSDEAGTVLEGLPPFSIISQTISDGDEITDPDALNSLNTDGITFKFNRSIRGGRITIHVREASSEELQLWRRETQPRFPPFGSKLLMWSNKRSSHSVTITPSLHPKEGQKLVKGKIYTIQLRGFRDVLGYNINDDIEFSTVVPVPPRRPLHSAP